MEHKQIQGDSTYLAFARSRIKALRASGLRYAAQKFEVFGTEIRVKIVGDDDFIWVKGKLLNVLSGITKDAALVTLPVVPPATTGVTTLRSFKPTRDAWVRQLKSDPNKSPTVFGDENRFGYASEQYGGGSAINASMYSGLMAKAVQLIMGVGITDATPTGLAVAYNYTWAVTHGIVTATDGKLWLIEISATNGVIAMPFAVQLGGSSASEQPVSSEAHKWFKGLPTGASFPVSGPGGTAAAQIAAAITTGSIIRLATPGSLSDFHNKTPWAAWVGWSFNNKGTEAHNTCYTRVFGSPVYISTSYHYKLAISIGKTVAAADRQPNQALAVGSAVLTLESSGQWWGASHGVGAGFYVEPWAFANPQTGVCQINPEGTLEAPSKDFDFPIFACHIKDELDVVRCSFGKVKILEVPTRPYGTGETENAGVLRFLQQGFYITSKNFAGSQILNYSTVSQGVATSSYVTMTLNGGADMVDVASTSVIFPGSDRDSYALFKNGDKMWNAGSPAEVAKSFPPESIPDPFTGTGPYSGIPTSGYIVYPPIDSFYATPPTVSLILRSGQIVVTKPPVLNPNAVYLGPAQPDGFRPSLTTFSILTGFIRFWTAPGAAIATLVSVSSVVGATGDKAHVAFTQLPMPYGAGYWDEDAKYYGLVLKGAEFSGEPTASTHTYNFTGYV